MAEEGAQSGEKGAAGTSEIYRQTALVFGKRRGPKQINIKQAKM